MTSRKRKRAQADSGIGGEVGKSEGRRKGMEIEMENGYMAKKNEDNREGR